MTGYTPEELIGKSSMLLYPDQEEFDTCRRGKIQADGHWLERESLKQGGQKRMVQ